MKKMLRRTLGASLLAMAAAVAHLPSAQAADKAPLIGMSNAYYGNTWRHQMVSLFKTAADDAKAKGDISGYIIANADGTPNQQIAQISDMILKHVDVLILDPASESSLNGILAKACARGITVVAFDGVVNAPCAYKLNFDFGYQTPLTEYIAKRLGGKGNILQVRGLPGSSPDRQMYDGQMKALAEYPGIKVVGTVYGRFTGAIAQTEVSNILPTLPHVDAVLCQGGGDDFGIAKAFEQSPAYKDKLPIIAGGGSSDFIRWWAEQNKKNGYTTESMNTSPGVVTAAMWFGIAIHNGAKVSTKTFVIPAATVTQENLAQYANLAPGQVVAPSYDKAWVETNLIHAQ